MSAAVVLRSRTFRSLRRHHNYRLFFAGQVVSLAGSWMQNVALAWLVLQLSRSPLAVAALIFCRFAPYTLLGIPAGAIVDRLDTRRLVMWTQAAAMLVSIALAAVALTGTASLPIVYVLAALGGVTLVLDAPGRQTLTFEMVGPRELPNAVALNSGLLNASRVIGPAIAGVMIATVGIGACFAINALSFLAVLTALALMRTDELHRVEKAPDATVLRGTREGLRFAASTPEIRAVLIVVTVVGLVGFNFNTLVPLLAADTLHVGAGAFGLLSAAFGAGAFVGALVTASLRRASWRAFSGGSRGVQRADARPRARSRRMGGRCAARGDRRLFHPVRRQRERARSAGHARPPAWPPRVPLPVCLRRARPVRGLARRMAHRARRHRARIRGHGGDGARRDRRRNEPP